MNNVQKIGLKMYLVKGRTAELVPAAGLDRAKHVYVVKRGFDNIATYEREQCGVYASDVTDMHGQIMRSPAKVVQGMTKRQKQVFDSLQWPEGCEANGMTRTLLQLLKMGII